jgi:hypothetical protein
MRRPSFSGRHVMRIDAVSDFALAAFLLASSWDRLFEFLGLPIPEPSVYAQLLGVALVALGLVEWTIGGRPGQREVARAVAVGRAIGAVVLTVWLAVHGAELDVHGAVILWSIAATLAVETVLYGWVWISGGGDP